MKQPKHVADLEAAIRATHGCDAEYLDRVTLVTEMFGDKVAWEGAVRTFRLVGHPKAKRCYAWSLQEGDETKVVSVLEIPPVDSPQTAVKVAIAAKARQ